MKQIFDLKTFAEEKDNVLIAPAGFGKTHTIAECLKYTEGKQLILTHTQAGVSSIKDKLSECLIDKNKYSVETISSFAQRYVLAFDNSVTIPDLASNQKVFYSYLIDKALEVFSSRIVRDVIRISYKGLFVDEYQDCTVKQHKLILILADILPTHVLGDPLQGIFDFAEPLVDLNDKNQMGRFATFHHLKTPHRWIKGGNEQLGSQLIQIRENLIKNIEINLLNYTAIEYISGTYRSNSAYIMSLFNNNESVLVIHPILIPRQQISYRQSFVENFKHIPILIESLDHEDFYNWAKHFDNETNKPFDLVLDQFITGQFSNLDNWYNKKTRKFKDKDDPKDEDSLKDIKKLHIDLQSRYSLLNLKELLLKIKNLNKVNCTRKDLLYSLCASMENSHYSNITVLKAMQNHRNTIRRKGRRVSGKCVGTTLLTKGLEFEVVVVLDADKFTDPRNLYVALSRCTKKLVVLANSSKLNPYT